MPDFDPKVPNPIITLRVASFVRRFLPIRLTGILTGLAPGRAEQWLRRGKAGEPDFVSFYNEVSKALGEVRQVERKLVAALAEVRRRACAGDPEYWSFLEYFGLTLDARKSDGTTTEPALKKNRRAAVPKGR